ncbi:MAG: FHA domain-containing protein [Clostridiales bacterium]|nr:FHA domain-containing protein [Clostridiales bacterium]MCD7828020.1 FHA domain-containing protein [Clostridiales bacterium]
MNLTRCENGHFYDADRFDSCPHCNDLGGGGYDSTVSMPMPTMASEILKTEPLSTVIQTETAEAPEEDGNQKTVGYFQGSIGLEPVVGWLVCIEGSHFGEDFRIKVGRNFIGRAPTMDIALVGDSSVSREKHAVILYEPKNNMFIVQPGESRELSYLNNAVVLNSVEIKAYDILQVGESKLLFVPLCVAGKFNWDDMKTPDKDETKE